MVDKETFGLVGVKTRLPWLSLGRNMEQFDQSLDSRTARRLQAISDVEPLGILGVTLHLDDQGNDTEVEYWNAVATTAEPLEGFDSFQVPAGQWVVFTHQERLQQPQRQTWAATATELVLDQSLRPELLSIDHNEPGGLGCRDLWIPIEPETGPL